MPKRFFSSQKVKELQHLEEFSDDDLKRLEPYLSFEYNTDKK
jgi:hypothetical protein